MHTHRVFTAPSILSNVRRNALAIVAAIGLASSMAACSSSESDATPIVTAPCPAGPEAPLGAECTSAGKECKYGYASVECGGRTVVCTDGKWTEKEHTDPQPSCFDSGSDADDADPADADADADAAACPTGPEAPLGTECTSSGLECKYGYDPIECGGRTVVCTEGKWVEKEHTDPQPSCLDSGTSD